MKISKILSYVVLAVGALGIILWFVMNGKIGDLMAESGVSEARDLSLEAASSAVSPLYNLTLVIFIIVVVVTLIAVFSALAKNPAGLKKTAIGLVSFLLVVGIGYGLAQGVETPLKDGEVLSAGGSRWVGAGLYVFYFLSAIAVGLMVVSGIKKLIK
ncbi:hypothetical protein ACFSTE_07495 [Aquimarina hainanensis]|uniref:Uncharacterized protein n=1 Tax=Aquimarina hainanensis TaxID=1578017 RepID=A0ABW5N6T8_9FLAO|nr:hypothetical protein [Aquimarina sp. TRL1]QKX05088.1 hypothetical protein HN014_09210 [Aquimarina sp. TRL1]